MTFEILSRLEQLLSAVLTCFMLDIPRTEDLSTDIKIEVFFFFLLFLTLVGICAFCASFSCSMQYQERNSTEFPTHESLLPKLMATNPWTQHDCCLNICNPLNLRNVPLKHVMASGLNRVNANSAQITADTNDMNGKQVAQRATIAHLSPMCQHPLISNNPASKVIKNFNSFQIREQLFFQGLVPPMSAV